MTAATALGLVRLGRIDVAIPAELVAEVVPGPIEVSPLPRSVPHVLGAFVLRGNPIPVIDLAVLLRREDEPMAGRPVAFALVIRLPRGTFAVQVDEVLGVVHPADTDVTAVETNGLESASIFSHLYTDPATRKIFAILDLEAILRIDDLHSAVQREAAGGAEGRSSGFSTYLTFTVGGCSHAIAISDVRHVCRRTGQLDSTLQGRVMRGFHRIMDETLPVVDFPALVGRETTGREPPSGACFLVVERAGRAFVTCVDTLDTIESVAADRIEPLSAMGRAEAACTTGSYVSGDRRTVLVVDAGALVERADVVDRGSLFAEGAAGPREAVNETDEPSVQLLIYRVGGIRLATPLQGISAVIRLPDEHSSHGDMRRDSVGLCIHEGRTINLVDLGRLLGRPPTPLTAGQLVLVVDGGEGLRGYVVGTIEFLHSAPLLPLPFPDRSRHGRVPPFTRMVRARRDGSDFAACVLDLAGLPAQPAGSSDTGEAA